MKTAIITGVAGFIGSNLAERLVKDYYVIGIDCLTDYYLKEVKMRNIAGLMSNENFEFEQADLTTFDLKSLDADLIFHQAAQPGVRASWGSNFEIYVRNNIIVTQRILEACKSNTPDKLVFASSSSVYGNALTFPTTEEQIPRPVSPYGVTKLAAENLCYLYWKNYGIPTVSLRYFTVFGPRLRPDMAIYKFVDNVLKNEEILLYGDGSQSRDFTFVSDVVEANILAAKSSVEGEVFNIGSGTTTSVNVLIELIEESVCRKARKKLLPSQKGDVLSTLACIDKAKEILGYKPHVSMRQGMRIYIDWHESLYKNNIGLRS